VVVLTVGASRRPARLYCCMSGRHDLLGAVKPGQQSPPLLSRASSGRSRSKGYRHHFCHGRIHRAFEFPRVAVVVESMRRVIGCPDRMVQSPSGTKVVLEWFPSFHDLLAPTHPLHLHHPGRLYLLNSTLTREPRQNDARWDDKLHLQPHKLSSHAPNQIIESCT
jgi:hypothetical protein